MGGSCGGRHVWYIHYGQGAAREAHRGRRGRDRLALRKVSHAHVDAAENSIDGDAVPHDLSESRVAFLNRETGQAVDTRLSFALSGAGDELVEEQVPRASASEILPEGSLYRPYHHRMESSMSRCTPVAALIERTGAVKRAIFSNPKYKPMKIKLTSIVSVIALRACCAHGDLRAETVHQILAGAAAKTSSG